MLRRFAAVVLVLAGAAALIGGVFYARQGDADGSGVKADVPLPALQIPAAGGFLTIFGDSWAAGTGAKPTALGFANQAGFALKLKTTIIGVGGSGYLPNTTTGVPDFLQRLTTAPVDDRSQLLVIEGGINDLGEGPVEEAARKTIQMARVKYPRANIVVLGPPSPGIPVNAGLTQLSAEIGKAAHQQGVYFISPIRRNWVTPSNIGWFINPRSNHPTTAGHTYLAELLVDALKVLADRGQGSAIGA